jgi:hypothetical protein
MSGYNLFLNATERLYPSLTRGLSADQAREFKRVLWKQLDPFTNEDDDDSTSSDDPYEMYALGSVNECRRNLWNTINSMDHDDISSSVKHRFRDAFSHSPSEYYRFGTCIIKVYKRMYRRLVLEETLTVLSVEEIADGEGHENDSDSSGGSSDWD